VIALAVERYAKNLWSAREAGDGRSLSPCQDETEQADFVISKILEHREPASPCGGRPCCRASHHSMLLEAELTASVNSLP